MPSMVLKSLRHFLLVSEMIGVEGCVTGEFVMMVVNLQTLGVPIALTSVPLVVSALLSIVLIPGLGYINERCARTRTEKAASLIVINIIQIIGASLIVVGNVLKLLDEQTDSSGSDFNHTTDMITTTISPAFQNIVVDSFSHLNQTWSVIGYHNLSSVINNNNNNINMPNIDNLIVSGINNAMDGEADGNQNEVDSIIPAAKVELKLYAILAMVGYIMNDSGYDTGSCFLKTFALTCSPPGDHPSVIVKAIIVSSVGGIMVTLFGAINVGKKLFPNSGLDASSLSAVFIFGVFLVVFIVSMITTIVAGLCCMWDDDSDDDQIDYDPNDGAKPDGKNKRFRYDSTDERQRLLTTSFISNNSTANEDSKPTWQSSVISSNRFENSTASQDMTDKIWQLSHSGAHSFVNESISLPSQSAKDPLSRIREFRQPTGQYNIVIREDHPARLESLKTLFKTHKLRINLCIATYIGNAALISFNIYSVNFVATSIFKGDATADAGSEAYQNYRIGIEAGATGLLVFYSSFVIATTIHAFVVQKIGWWRHLFILFALNVVSNVTVSVTESVYVYYVTAMINGQNRAVMFSTPYILVCRVLSQHSKGDSTRPGQSASGRSWDIALVSAMLPVAAFTVSVVIGPTIQATENAAIPLYFTSIASAVCLLLFALLRKY